MEKQLLDRWAEKLLDTGKMNNLIKFKNSKNSSVEIVCPDVLTLFSKASKGNELEVYDAKLEEDEFEEEQPKKNSLSKEEYYEKYAAKIKKSNQVLPYNTAMTPITALRNIEKKAKTALEETGVNVAYMVFGFINWKERDDSDITMSAPVLLVPISLERESQISPYVIKFSDDDIVLNPTFQYKMQAEYNVTLPEYDDEDITVYLDSIRKKVNKLGWFVTNECKIGIFSFLKINMYHDLKNNQDVIMQNENVRKLLGENVQNDALMDTDDVKLENPLVSLHSVVDADSSQIEAIEMAKSGKSFVLQGPPGTGKSQTITNVIAECLYDGKKVLFVSEKQAALNVVYDKLRKAGLSEFCLELHSHKANKKSVIEDLCHTLREEKKSVSEKAEAEIEDKIRRQTQLDQYEAELHKKRKTVNQSLYNLYDAYSACRNVQDLEAVIHDIANKGARYLKDTVVLFNEYVDYTESVGYDFRLNPWYGFIGQDASYQAVKNIQELIGSIIEPLRSLQGLSEELGAEYDLPVECVAAVEAISEFWHLMADADIITPSLVDENSIECACGQMKDLCDEGLKVKGMMDSIDAEFETDVYDWNAEEDGKKLKKLYAGNFSRLFSKEYNDIVKRIRMFRKTGKRVSYKEAVECADTLAAYHASRNEFDVKEAAIKPLLGEAYQGLETDWGKVIGQLERLSALTQVIDFGNIGTMAFGDFVKRKTDFTKYATALDAIKNQYDSSFLKLSGFFDDDLTDLYHMSLANLIAKLESCQGKMEDLGNWIAFFKLITEIKDAGAYDILTEAIEKNARVADIPQMFQKAYYRQWIEGIIQTSPVLAKFTRASHDQAVKEFAMKDREQFEISKAQIKSELSQKRPSVNMVVNGSSVQILLREETKKRKQKSIRKLLAETADIVQVIKPCFLMSPLSVSTFLESQALHFDVVVFDEASQIFPQDAIGSIYRADQAIIVGDSKQMPPSNFFSSTIDADDEDEESDVNDFESILDLCSTAMPRLQLRWHYRSHYEQLISFSNKNFYDNHLITFPAAITDRRGIGVDYYFVNGEFDRQSKTNRMEAERVVEMIYENIKQRPDKSMGVVAFSVSQSSLIDKLLMKKRQENPQYESYFKADNPEPFFIKNLETVQGDERDIIIFSIAYGKGTDGRLINNFGPVNREGGERRLNVAVSRAKDNVQVITSMHYSDIDLKGTASNGARLLREYLDYAENGQIALDRTISVNQYEDFDSDFELEVYDFLRENGFSVDTQVGCSGYKIDLALKRPDSSDYVLAIECDGASYHSSANARDRDRLRQTILENMGWKFYRIWSTDWFRNKRTAKQKLLSACKEAIMEEPYSDKESSPEKTVAASQKTNKSKESKVTKADQVTSDAFLDASMGNTDAFQKYLMVDVTSKRCIDLRRRDFRQFVREVLMTEAPLSEEWFLQRICFMFGREKVTNVVWQEFEYLMQSYSSYGIIRKDGFMYLKDAEIVFRVPADSWSVRDIKNIAIEELATGIMTFMQQNKKAEKLGLYKAISGELGFSRTGSAISGRLDMALRSLGDSLDIQGDIVSLKE
jgi:superfamily I DNA and/or RNA helicase